MLNYPSFFNGVSAPYEIEQSLRFDGSSYLTRTSGSSGAQTFTLSFWSKKTGVANYNYPVFGGGSTTNNYGYINYNNGQYLTFGHRTSGSGDWNSIPNASYRDTGAWYHHVVVLDFSNATQGDRYRLYTNGVEVDSFSAQTLPSNTTTTTQFFRSGENIRIGCNSYNTSNFFDGYFAEFHCVYGSALDPDQFGEFDNNGVWRPIKYTGSHGTEGFYLKFDPSATNGIGHDHSGNGNHFTASGFTTSGTGTDVMSDTPTTNWCTLNPLFNNGTEGPGTLSEGNLRHTSDDNYAMCPGTMSLRNGKYYWEAQPISIGTSIVGIIRGVNPAENTYIGYDTNGNVFGFGYSHAGSIYGASGTGTTVGATLATGQTTYIVNDIIGIAVDIPNGTLDWYINGTLAYAVTGINDADWFPAVSSYSSDTWEVNFGQRAFAYTPPTGYKPLNTSNLTAPTVKDGSKYFDTTLWSGDGTSPRTISNGSFQPDLVWTKTRSDAVGHFWFDSVRGFGASKEIMSHSTREEGNSTTNTAGGGYVSGVTSTGFEVTAGSLNDNFVNDSGRTYVAWNWLAGGSGSSIAAGSIDGTNPTIASTVSANPSAGFSIVSHTGNTTAGATVGHGLGVAPSMIILKNRDTADHWPVYHASLGATKALLLNDSGAASTSSVWWNNTAPTSTVFSLGTGTTNYADAYIAYCFAEVEGYSKFGSYTGNGSTDGPFVYTGFKPAWLMVKKDAASTDWKIYDAGRENYNVMSARLAANTTAAELSGNAQEIDFVSNGFKFRGTNGDQNSSGTFYYAAFASSPFGGFGVSPATAR